MEKAGAEAGLQLTNPQLKAIIAFGCGIRDSYY